MPDWNGGAADINVRNRRSVSFKQQFTGGHSYTISLGNGLLGDANFTLNEVSSLRASLGAASNFGIRYQEETLRNEVAAQFVQAFDDAYGVGVVLNLRFQNNDQDTFTFTMAAPLKRLFSGESRNVVTPDVNAAAGTGEAILGALVRDIENMVNNSFLPVNSYAFAGGERSTRKMTPSVRPDIIELIEPDDDLVQPAP